MSWRHALLIEPASSDDLRTDFAGTFVHCDPGAAALPLAELSAQRGDGVFETLGVVDGRPHQVEAHLERLARSAAILGLPAPHAGQWRQAIAAAAASCGPGEVAIKLVLSRGLDDGRGPTAWLTATPSPDFRAVRDDGIRVVTLDRGVDLGAADRAPWLLLGAKTLSYATNMAAIREAKARGADDALFVTSDGYVLEAPTATVLLRFDGRFTTPSPSAGILHGTTQMSAFAWLRAQGHEAEYRDVPVADLGRADAVWLLSSVRLAAPVRELDGRAVPIDRPLTRALNDALLARTS